MFSPNRVATPRSRRWLPVLCLGLTACDAPTAPDNRLPPPPAWDDQQEVLYQIREVIRFVEAQEQLRSAQLEALGITRQEAGTGQSGIEGGPAQAQQD